MVSDTFIRPLKYQKCKLACDSAVVLIRISIIDLGWCRRNTGVVSMVSSIIAFKLGTRAIQFPHPLFCISNECHKFISLKISYKLLFIKQ